MNLYTVYKRIMRVALLCVLMLFFVTPIGAFAGAPSEATLQLQMLNEVRTQNGLPKLKVDRRLTTSALWLAQDMANKGYADHVDSANRPTRIRLLAFGYPARRAWTGENLAGGRESAAATLQQFLNSPKHLANLLNPHYRYVGIARVYVPNSQYGWYWVQDFGSVSSLNCYKKNRSYRH